MVTLKIKIAIVGTDCVAVLKTTDLAYRMYGKYAIGYILDFADMDAAAEGICQADIVLVVGKNTIDTESIKDRLENYGFAGIIAAATLNNDIPTKGADEPLTKWDEFHFNFGDGTTTEEFSRWLIALMETMVRFQHEISACCC